MQHFQKCVSRQFCQGFLYKMTRKKVTENRLWSCNAKEPINKNRLSENIQVNLFDAPAASVGAADLLQPLAPPKRTDAE